MPNTSVENEMNQLMITQCNINVQRKQAEYELDNHHMKRVGDGDVMRIEI